MSPFRKTKKKLKMLNIDLLHSLFLFLHIQMCIHSPCSTVLVVSGWGGVGFTEVDRGTLQGHVGTDCAVTRTPVDSLGRIKNQET